MMAVVDERANNMPVDLGAKSPLAIYFNAFSVSSRMPMRPMYA